MLPSRLRQDVRVLVVYYVS
ncbi:hypothetical protein Zm00014a_019204 [Zea mays]|uniref:Uncharacterized protein n=1 Tax=Zea mays TaxID=4577 RepID=A0A3L6EWK5_MAIZE|nr:hypothetical protein Zm00014a_019204 [Zea mays]